MTVYTAEPVEAPQEILTEQEQRARMLEAAALEIEVRGWAQGSSCTADGRTCLVGGIALALGYDPTQEEGIPNEAMRPVVDAWGRFDGGFSPMSWNDGSARSADEVAMVLRWRADEVRRGVA